MSCRTPDVFFRQLSNISVYMAEQMLKTGRRFSMQFLRRRPGIYEPVIERRINVRIEPLEFCKCLWLMRHHHAYPPSSQRNFVHIDIWRARSNLRSTSSCGIQSWITDPLPIMGNALKNRTGLPVRSSCSFHFSAIVFILSFSMVCHYTINLRSCVACRNPFGISRLLGLERSRRSATLPLCSEVLAFTLSGALRTTRPTFGLRPGSGRKVPSASICFNLSALFLSSSFHD